MSDNFIFATSKKEPIESEVSQETVINYTKAPFTFLLFQTIKSCCFILELKNHIEAKFCLFHLQVQLTADFFPCFIDVYFRASVILQG